MAFRILYSCIVLAAEKHLDFDKKCFVVLQKHHQKQRLKRPKERSEGVSLFAICFWNVWNDFYQLVLLFFSPRDATIHLIVLCMGRALNYNNQHHADIYKMVCICEQVRGRQTHTERKC